MEKRKISPFWQSFWGRVIGGLAIALGLSFLTVLGIGPEIWAPSIISGLPEWLQDPLIWLQHPLIRFAATALIVWLSINWWPKKRLRSVGEWIYRKRPFGITWSYDQFLWISGKLDNLKLISFNASGTNKGRKSITGLDGYLENLDTGKKVRLYFHNQGRPKLLSEVEAIMPGKTFRILAPFCGEFGDTFHKGPHLPFIDCYRKWKKFRFVFKYNGKTYSKQFSEVNVKRELETQISRLLGK